VPDVIRLLSDHLANQIAAGEVIQRPASAVKELLENAVDAGATNVQLILKDAGKELIQVVDDGCGMSPTDARMSFERHATSKIKDISDLFSIRTMGFRGEALASMAAVAQIELKSRREEDAIGTRLLIEATEVKLQEACATPVGTSLSVKNLFYNVPARRHFLKSNTTETRHIVDEFTRVAMAYPGVAFRMFHNGAEQLRLESGTPKARIVGLLGNSYERNLVPVEEDLDFLSIKGFIGKPEAAARTRGNQFFFVNGRFVKSPYLHHAVTAAYDALLERDTFPFYVLFLEIDPGRVDVNVHPTKQEVKFEDDKLLYSCLQSAVRHALARYNIAPSLDFTLDSSVTDLPAIAAPITDQDIARVQGGFLAQSFSTGGRAHAADSSDALEQWKARFQQIQGSAPIVSHQAPALLPEEPARPQSGNALLVQGSLLLTTVKSGVMLVHVRRAQERILFERVLEHYNRGAAPSQQVLFPVALELPPGDAALLNEILPDLARIGFDIVPMGTSSFAVQGVPTDLPPGEERAVVDEVVELLKHESLDVRNMRADRLLMALAKRLSRNAQAVQHPEGQQALIDELFACRQPEYTPDGKPVFRILPREELDQLLG
jgi:DNA mismatch repair protein MutL